MLKDYFKKINLRLVHFGSGHGLVRKLRGVLYFSLSFCKPRTRRRTFLTFPPTKEYILTPICQEMEKC